ncbi:MAG TPA: ion channel [Tissierellaceae bacterium]|nr:ion channel [Tissierellaceae bacterium]
MKKNNKLLFIITLLLTLILTGIIGYSILLDLNFVDALYMTVITISTVGYGEVALMDAGLIVKVN